MAASPHLTAQGGQTQNPRYYREVLRDGASAPNKRRDGNAGGTTEGVFKCHNVSLFA